MARSDAAEVGALLLGAIAIAGYTALFVSVARSSICLSAVPPWYYYWRVYAVAVVALAVGVWAVLRASALLPMPASRVRGAAYLGFAVVMFGAASVRLFFTVGNMSMCSYLP